MSTLLRRVRMLDSGVGSGVDRDNQFGIRILKHSSTSASKGLIVRERHDVDTVNCRHFDCGDEIQQLNDLDVGQS